MELIHFKDIPTGAWFRIHDPERGESPLYRKLDSSVTPVYNFTSNYITFMQQYYLDRCYLVEVEVKEKKLCLCDEPDGYGIDNKIKCNRCKGVVYEQ